jgi:DNA-binding CsgD family transcriptional regulator
VPISSTVPLLIGRDAELVRLDAVLSAVRAGESTALVLHGAPGAGKTALLDWSVSRAPEFRVLRAAGVQAETDIPYAGLHALVAPVLGERTRIPRPQRLALERAFALTEMTGGDRFAVGAALLSLLGGVAEDGPVVCAVDDAQWLDGPTLEAVRFAARRVGHEGVVLLLAARGETAPEVDLAGVERLAVAPLEHAAARELVAERAGAPVAAQVAERIVRSAAGNALALVEILDGLGREQLAGRIDFTEPLPPGASALDLYAARVAALPAGARRALLVTAVAGDAPADVVAAALTRVGTALADLEVAERGLLVERLPGRVRFRHPLAQAATYHAAGGPDRRAAHAAVAAVLGADDPRRPWHLAAAATRPEEEVAAALEDAAARARRQGGAASAAHANLRAAELTPDTGRRARRLVAAADDLLIAGLTANARRALDEALAGPVAPDVDARARAGLAEAELRDGRPRSACTALCEQASLLAAADPARAGLLMMKAAMAAMLAGDTGAWESAAKGAQELLSTQPEPLRALAGGLAAVARLAHGDRHAAPLVEHAMAAVAGLPELLRSGSLTPSGPVEIATLLAQASIWTEQWRPTADVLDGLLAALRDLAAPTAVVYPMTVRAWLDFRRGHWDRALAAAAESVALARHTNQQTGLAAALAIEATVRAGRGDAEACRAGAAHARASIERAGAAGAAVYPSTALSLLALGDGDIATALDELEHARAGTAAAGMREPGAMPWLGDHLEALVRAGRGDDARERIAELRTLPSLADRALGRALVARCEALLGGDAELDNGFAAALELHDRAGVPFERARTLLALGQRRRRARRPSDARAPLREALEIFDTLGARPWSRQARSELRAAGAAVPAATPPVFAGLTAHEVQVAELVAEGRTNREIAAALFIAPKTAEHHLSRVYRKLGIRRRSELARIAADLRPGHVNA